MRILGIETSCDETAAAVVEDGVKVLSSVISSQIDIHAATGGVVPEVAAREHVLKMMPVIDQAMQEAGIGLDEFDAVAVTQGPGLLSSLIIGYATGATLAQTLGKPLIPVNHVAGHIHSTWLGLNHIDDIIFPVMTLTVSGGHNDLVLQKDFLDYHLIGETLDDAAGEAFDKVARLLGLGYPGGPAISRVAAEGSVEAFNFPRAMIDSGNYDFSFSGLKTAVLQTIEQEHAKAGNLNEKFIADVAASFEECVCEILSTKLLRAAAKHDVAEVHLAGGVSANRRLRAMVEAKSELPVRYNANLSYCTDNAAMIAGVAFLMKGHDKKGALPEPQLDLYS